MITSSDDLERVLGCPECHSGDLEAVVLAEQTLAVKLHPEKGARIVAGDIKELFVKSLTCQKCGYVLWDLPEEHMRALAASRTEGFNF